MRISILILGFKELSSFWSKLSKNGTTLDLSYSKLKAQQDSQVYSVVSSFGLSGYTISVRDFESMRTNDTPTSLPPTSHKLDSRNDHCITPQTCLTRKWTE